MRNDLADRDDVVVEMREAQRMRLELLADELADVVAEAPAQHPGLDFAISAGTPPRFWIDSVAHVGLGRDRRTYRFVRDSRVGRVVLAESTDIKPVAEAVTRYVAERIVERQRALDGESLGAAPAEAEAVAQQATPGDVATPQAVAGLEHAAPARSRSAEFLSGFALLALGLLVGVAVTLAVLRDRVPELSTLLQ